MMQSPDTNYVERAIAECQCIASAYSMLRYLGYSPKNDTWKSYCVALKDKLGDELNYHFPSNNG